MSRCAPWKTLSIALALAGTIATSAAFGQDAARSSRRTVRATPRTAVRSPAAIPTPSPIATPAPAPAAEEPKNLPDGVELIQERYSNGSIKVERYVTQDAEGNYINHGPWTQYDAKGHKISEGEYRFGKQHGKWTRWFNNGEGKMFTAAIYKRFEQPFVSEVTLADGELHGTWTIYDGRDLKVAEWEFEAGKRHGKSIWYHPTGQRSREMDYREGEIDGKVLAWNEKNQLVQDDTYLQGHKHANRVLWHSPGHKRAEGRVLHSKEPLETGYDWWSGVIGASPAIEAGVDEKHGLWTWWYPNGQKYSEGRYLEDVPVGQWIFWHSNGQKNMQGEYAAGVQTSKWTWWREDGTVLRVEDYTGHVEADSLIEENDVEPSAEADAGEPAEEEAAPEVGRLRVPDFD